MSQRNFKKCVICGKEFPCPPSSKTTTCSKECRSERARRRAGCKLSDKARANISAGAKKRGMSADLQQAATAAAQASPKAGRFVTNSSAKSWTLISPEGRTYEVMNLRLWVRENADLFECDGSEKGIDRIARGFYTISRNVRLNQRGQTYKGWIVAEHDMRKNCEKQLVP